MLSYKRRYRLRNRLQAILHHIILVVMLHNTFVAPAQGILEAYFHNEDPYLQRFPVSGNAASAYSLESPSTTLTALGKSAGASARYENKGISSPKIITISSLDKEGVIGVSAGQPVDSPYDNVFRLKIDQLPEFGFKAYLRYELYGLSSSTGVAHSINNRMSVGGYIADAANEWSSQKEEINPEWLKSGENAVLFTLPQASGHQYRIKNLKLEFEPSPMNALLSVDQKNVVHTKDNKIYLHGFVRGQHNQLEVFANEKKIKCENGEFEAIIPLTEEMRKQKMVSIRAKNGLGLIGQEMVYLKTIKEADFMYKPEEKPEVFTKIFSQSVKGTLSAYDASITIGDSALSRETPVMIRELRAIDVAPMGSGIINVTKGLKAYRFLPDGTVFSKSVSISIPYDSLLIPKGFSPKDIRTFYFDTHTKRWTQVKRDSLNTAKRLVVSSTNHFTDYINGIIQNPESPETSAFTSTMMSDIKAADPAAEMTLISPPQASQTGEANISFPIKVPAGRHGMQPNLSINYNNNGGDDWLGLGWNIATPAITIDTKWGVPVHDNQYESELYNLNGEQLMYPGGYLPHRHTADNYSITQQLRSANMTGSSKVFTLRDAGSFIRVERFGSSPSEYYWKVTATDGTIYWYGGSTASDISTGNAVIKDVNGRIVHWALYMTQDVFGNQMKYTYESPSLAGLSSQYGNLADCKAFYLSKIMYTGYNDTSYHYQILFLRNTAVRPDVNINARLGVKQANPYLLDRIMVTYKGTDIIRSYKMYYATGAFNKTLLTAVAELDSSLTEFYRHNFTYYDDVAANNGHLFGSAQTVNLPTINADFTLGLGDLLNPSKISTTQTSNNGFSIKPSVGIELGSLSQKLKNILIGAPYSQNTTRSKGKIELVDIDGDGIDDILFKASDGLRYFPGVVNPDTNGNLVNTFAPGIKTIHNISDFSYGKIKTNSVFGDSWDLTLSATGNDRFMAGTERTRSKSEGKVYLTDANNDGLMDIVSNGAVSFNYIDPSTGEPTFTAESSYTPNMVLTSASQVVSEPVEQPEEQEDPDTVQDFDDKYDVVRVWQAPVDGSVNIKVKLINQSSSGTADFTVEKIINGNSCTLLHEHIVASTSVEYLITNNNTACDPAAATLRVQKGEQIYFRLHRNASGHNPDMIISTQVDYLTQSTIYASTSAFPENNLYSNSFMLTDKEPVTFPGSGTAAITWSTFQPTYVKDAVKYGIYTRGVNSQGNIVDTPVQEWNCVQGTATTISSSGLSAVSVSEGVSLVFKVFSDTNVFTHGSYATNQDGQVVGWWRPKVTYSPDSSAQSQGIQGFEKYVTPEYSIYHADSYAGDYLLKASSIDPATPSWTTPSSSATYGVKPNTSIVSSSYITSADNGSFIFAVRGTNGNIIDKRTVTIVSGVISVSNSNAPINFCTSCAISNSSVSFGPYKFEYYINEDNVDLFERFKLAVGGKTAVLNYGSWSASQNNKTGVVSAYYNSLNHLGAMLNNWGQFTYNSGFDKNTNTPTGPIGKLINPDLVLKPFSYIDLSGSALLDIAGCDASTMSSSAYEDCYNDALMNGLGIPAQGTDMSTIDPGSFISGLQSDLNLPNLNFNLPLIAMRPDMPDQSSVNDKWLGVYNSQYSSFSNMRSGSSDEISSSNSSSSGGSLSYPDFTDEDEPDTTTGSSLSGMKAINKIHRSSARSYSIGWSWKNSNYGASGTYSTSQTSYSNSVTDFMDINGDGYPDIVTTDAIQKTNRTGGHLADYGDPNTGTVTDEDNTSNAIVASGQYMRSGRRNYCEGNNDYESSLEAQIGVGVTANIGGEDKVNSYWFDVNGDGLPDRIRKSDNSFKVEFNYGQNVFGSSTTEFPYINSMESSPSLIAVNASIGGTGAANALGDAGYYLNVDANVGYSASRGRSDTVYIDINGDGLADKVDNNEVHFNQGVGFNNTAYGLNLEDSPNIIYTNNQSIGVNGTAGAFFGFMIYGIWIKAGLSFGAQSNVAINQDERNFKEMNGDGYVDYVRYENGQLKVYYSKIGRTNMLKTVENPLKGSFTMDYAANLKTYNDPNSRWVLKKVTVNDGYDKVNDGADVSVTGFIYQNGYYDRRERQFYGFETVKVQSYTIDAQNQPSIVYRTQVTKYHNQNYFMHGLVKESYVLKGVDENAVFSKTENTYVLNPVITATGLLDLTTPLAFTYDTGGTQGRRSAGALLTETTSYTYELGTTPLVSKVQMEYNNQARVTKYKYLGDPNNADDNYTTEIDYHTSATLSVHNLIGLPKEIRVKDNNGALKRKRQTTLASEDTGTIASVSSYYTATDVATTNMLYDVYGNMTKVTLPPNDNAMSMFYNYNYDTDMHKYLISVENAYGYTSSTTYNVYTDKVLTQTDIAGNTITNTYDNFYRLTDVTSPKELAVNVPYTIHMDYYPFIDDLPSGITVDADDFMPLAVTSHYDVQNSGNDIQTFTFIDGLGRAVQVKKDIQMELGDTFNEYMSVSGKAMYDTFGRAVRTYQPYYEAKNNSLNYVVNEYDAPYFSKITYDELDRATLIRRPDASATYNEFSIDGSTSTHKTRTRVDQIDQNQFITDSYLDVNGRSVKTVNVLTLPSSQELPTVFTYNSIGELLSYTDAEGISTAYTYDMLGRKTEINHPDNGITKYTYDKASNLIKLQTAKLAANTSLQPSERYINYGYEYNRLSAIFYPDINGNSNLSNVSYYYGGVGSGNNTGRLVYLSDATGEQFFEYGNMGELVHTERTVVGPNIPTRVFTTDFEYDSWNRIQRIHYPDGEAVTYSYDKGGNLKRVEGIVQGQPYPYIQDIQYDYYEQRTSLLYGNETYTTYEYSEDMRRLQYMEALTSSSESMFVNKYTYDLAGSVREVESATAPNSVNAMGGYYSHQYYYDSMNRLAGASGMFYGDDSQGDNGPVYYADYSYYNEYNATNGFSVKSNSSWVNSTQAENYEDHYHYISGTHKLEYTDDVSSGYSKHFDYDPNGNILKSYDANTTRVFFWDESNRLRVLDDLNQMHHYIYDAAGERVLKASSDGVSVYENGTAVNQSAVNFNTYTTYPSGYIVVDGQGQYTKHYYAGSERVVSRIGEDDASIFEPGSTGRMAPSADNKDIKKLDPEALRQLQIKDLNIMLVTTKRGIASFKEYQPGTAQDTTGTGVERMAAQTQSAPVAPSQFPYAGIYFYHPDHLGTTTFLTDANGMPYQMFINKPFGETLVEQHSLTEDYETPYKFNGKELDSETGLYYYGARYYEPRTSIWLSVDPMGDKYPNYNPYVYCMQNPVNLVDPTGMSADGWITTENADGTKTHNYNPNINTCEEAEAAGYTNVVDVRAALTVSAKDGSYSFYLDSGGGVTNALWGGVPVTLHPICGTDQNVVITDGGTAIVTSTISVDMRPQGGQITSMEFSSPFFPMGAVLGSAYKGLGATLGTVGKSAGTEAAIAEQTVSAPIQGTTNSPILIPRYTNVRTTILGRSFTGHALDEMQSSGIMPRVVDDVILNGSKVPGRYPGTFLHELDGVRVITNESGGVITVMPRTH